MFVILRIYWVKTTYIFVFLKLFLCLRSSYILVCKTVGLSSRKDPSISQETAVSSRWQRVSPTLKSRPHLSSCHTREGSPQGKSNKVWDLLTVSSICDHCPTEDPKSPSVSVSLLQRFPVKEPDGSLSTGQRPMASL